MKSNHTGGERRRESTAKECSDTSHGYTRDPIRAALTQLILGCASSIVLPAVVLAGPLDAPARKTVTVRTEIHRGLYAIRTECGESISPTQWVECITDVLHRTQQKQQDTDGFLLGAKFWAWFELKRLLRPESLESLSPQEAELAKMAYKDYYSDFKILRKRLKLKNTDICAAAELKCDAFTESVGEPW